MKNAAVVLAVILVLLLGAVAVTGFSLVSLNSKLGVAKTQLETAERRLDEHVAQMQTLKQEAESLMGQMDKVINDNEKKLLPPFSPIPVQVTWRKAEAPATGLAPNFQNNSDHFWDFLVTVSRANSPDRLSFMVTLEPNAGREVPAQEGWIFSPGDTLTIIDARYKPLTVQIPPLSE